MWLSGIVQKHRKDIFHNHSYNIFINIELSESLSDTRMHERPMFLVVMLLPSRSKRYVTQVCLKAKVGQVC